MHVESRKGDLFMRFRKTITVLLAIIISFTMNGIQALAQEDVNDDVTPETIAVVEQDATSMDEVLGNGSEPDSSDEVQETSNGISVKESTDTTTNDEVKVVEEVNAESNSKQTTDKTASSKSTSATNVTKTANDAKTTSAAKTTYSKTKLRLMATLIFCEAGAECYAGKKAVGIVVMNRKKSKSFPNTIKGVIYQKYQFGPVRNGALKRAMSRYDSGKFNTKAEKDCIRAAKEALNNEKTVTYKGKNINLKSYHYFSGKVKNYRIQIGNHQFK